MKIIKVSTSGDKELAGMFLRQTPGQHGVWGDCRFIVNQRVERCDWWVICHGSSLTKPETVLCDPDHVVYISMEPGEGNIDIANKFLSQFSKVVLCDRNVSHPNIIHANGLTWWVGMNVRHENGHHFSPEFALDYDALKAMDMPVKMNRISVICSKNQSLPGHHKRLEFLDRLKAHPIAEHIDFFGGGFNPIGDKWDAIAPYKYHLVLENSVVPNYWSEKLGDAFLGFSYPVYYGCPNISDYFSKDALSVIDIGDFEQTVTALQNLIDNDPYTQHVEAVLQARSQVLDQYNIFQLMADICDRPAQNYANCTVKPVSHIARSWPRRTAGRLIHRVGGLLARQKALWNSR